MDAWVKMCIVLLMLTLLSWVIGYVMYDPFIGLILMAVILTLMVLTLEPATGKAMAQVVIPLVVLLFVFEVFLGNAQFDTGKLLVIAVVLFLMVAMFAGGGSFLHGGFLNAKVALKFCPIYALAIVVATLADPSHQLAVYIMAGTALALMGVYMVLLRDYDKWPDYTFGPTTAVAITDLAPKGKVKSGAEIWWARTVGDHVKTGQTVRVLGVSGMTMLVVPYEEEESGPREGLTGPQPSE